MVHHYIIKHIITWISLFIKTMLTTLILPYFTNIALILVSFQMPIFLWDWGSIMEHIIHRNNRVVSRESTTSLCPMKVRFFSALVLKIS